MGNRQFLRVGDRQQRPRCAQLGEAGSRAAVEMKLGRSVPADYFDSGPEDTPRMTGSKRFHRGFLGGEARGKRRGEVASAAAIRDFTGGEHTPDETIAPAFNGLGDAADFRGVDTDADDVHVRDFSSNARVKRGRASW